MITLQDVKKAQDERRAAYVLMDKASHGWRANGAYQDYVDTIAAHRRADVCARMMEGTFKTQLKQIVGAALSARSDEWEGLPAHYKRTLRLLESIANDALQAAGIEGVTAIARDNGQKGVSHDTYIDFSTDGHVVSFRRNEGDTVDMQVRMWGNAEYDSDTLYNEYFSGWYGKYGHADSLSITAKDVRRMARRYARDMERIEELNARYSERVKAIEAPYRHMGVHNDFYMKTLLPHR